MHLWKRSGGILRRVVLICYSNYGIIANKKHCNKSSCVQGSHWLAKHGIKFYTNGVGNHHINILELQNTIMIITLMHQIGTNIYIYYY